MNAHATGSKGLNVKVDPRDGRSVREKFLEAHIVSVTQPNGAVKVVKTRWGYCGVVHTETMYENEIARAKANNAHLEVKVWRLGWYEAQALLKGLVSL